MEATLGTAAGKRPRADSTDSNAEPLKAARESQSLIVLAATLKTLDTINTTAVQGYTVLHCEVRDPDQWKQPFTQIARTTDLLVFIGDSKPLSRKDHKASKLLRKGFLESTNAVHVSTSTVRYHATMDEWKTCTTKEDCLERLLTLCKEGGLESATVVHNGCPLLGVDDLDKRLAAALTKAQPLPALIVHDAGTDSEAETGSPQDAEDSDISWADPTSEALKDTPMSTRELHAFLKARRPVRRAMPLAWQPWL